MRQKLANNLPLIEALAAIEHQRWAHWQRYLHDKCSKAADGSLIIPAELVARWEHQIKTPYAELNASEQESDRVQVRGYLAEIDRRQYESDGLE